MKAPPRQPEVDDPGFAGRPIRVGGTILGAHRHICTFFHSHDDERGRVARRTQELTAANQALRREALERTRGAEALAEIRNATVRRAEALGG
jgi:hypothetical protein